MKAYSLDLRQRVLKAALSGEHTIAEVAEVFGVGTTFVNKMLGLHREGQDLAPRPHGGGQKARLSATHHKMLRSEYKARFVQETARFASAPHVLYWQHS